METLLPAQPLSHNHQSEPAPASKSASKKADGSSSVLSAGSKPHLLYKCLLDQLAQKLKIAPPRYQTRNEGFDHVPMFRSTVTFDGVSYTSSNTFQQRKMAEMDASRIAYIATTQKAKTEALSFLQEDKTFCKSILAEFAAKKDLKIPIYETTQLEASLPVFRSNLFFDGVTYPGDNGKSKKEAEQLAARSVIMKYLGTEAGNDMAMVVNCRLRQYQEINKVLEINSAQISSNVSGAQTEAGTSTIAATLESSLGQCTVVPVPSAGVPQPILPHLSVEPIIPVSPVVVQPPTPQVSSTVPVVTQSSASQVAVELIKPAVAEVLTPIPSAVVNNPCTPLPPAPLVEVPKTERSSNVTVAEVLTPIPSAVVNNPCTPLLPAPLVEIPKTERSSNVTDAEVLTPIPSAAVNNPCTPLPPPAPLVEIPATDLSSNVIQQVKVETSPAEALEYIPLVGETSKKKRNRKNKKNARKKMRADAQMPVVPASEVLPFSSQ